MSGYAFPWIVKVPPNTESPFGPSTPAAGLHFALGLSKREQYASMALQGLLANPGGPVQASSQAGWGYANCDHAFVAREAVALADALIEALK